MAAPPLTWQRRGDLVEIGLPHQQPAELVPDLVAAVNELLGRAELDGAVVHLVADHPSHEEDHTADKVSATAGFHPERTLLYLCRPLPIAPDDPLRPDRRPIPVRPYRREDAEAW